MKYVMGGLVAVVAGLAAVLTAGAGTVGVLTGAAPAGAAPVAAGPLTTAVYMGAAAACPGLPWQLLAAIGTVESQNGTSTLPGVHAGANFAGAEGPMQMEPATFAAFDRPVPPGGASPPSPYDPVDAAYAAARCLCASGAAGGADLAGAVYAYNHSRSYVAQVMALAGRYRAGSSAALLAVRYALAQVGTPYRWGGESAGVGFDCSGLVQAAYAAAGVALPRLAQAQYEAGPVLDEGAPLEAGDLVFFGASLASVEHVGLYVGDGGGQALMVDAPHAAAVVRVEPFSAVVGAWWGGEHYLGATRP